jgi:hypothetical protein
LGFKDCTFMVNEKSNVNFNKKQKTKNKKQKTKNKKQKTKTKDIR